MSKNGNPPPYSPPYGQQPPGFYQPPAEQPVIISPPGPTVVVSQAVPVGPTPTSTQCPSCHANIVTTMETETTTKTHVIALLLCLIGCWPCCLIPYCTDSCQAKTHYCPNCRAYLGKFDS